MSTGPERAIFTVGLHDGMWSVEHDGQFFDHSVDKEVAKAAANRRARQSHDGGRPSQVKIAGEGGYFERT